MKVGQGGRMVEQIILISEMTDCYLIFLCDFFARLDILIRNIALIALGYRKLTKYCTTLKQGLQ